jgi:DNA-binding NtrC family response regulator
MKVLVVDDNHSIGDMIQQTLEAYGIEAIYAQDGLAGYWAYLRFHPDLVITDIHMPRKNGPEMMKHIRIHNPMIQTIYMSGDLDSVRPLLSEEKKQYPVSYFGKPFCLESLVHEVMKNKAHSPSD